VHQNIVREHFLAFELNILNRKGNCVWRIVWVAVIWNVWIHRNNIVFSNMVLDVLEIFTPVQEKTWAWITCTYRNSQFWYSGWCLNSIICLRSIS